MTDLLDGAGNLPRENERTATPETFAARWNARNHPERQAWLDAVHDAFAARDRCFQLNHDGLREIAEQQAQLLGLVRGAITDYTRNRPAAEVIDEIGLLLE